MNKSTLRIRIKVKMTIFQIFTTENGHGNIWFIHLKVLKNSEILKGNFRLVVCTIVKSVNVEMIYNTDHHKDALKTQNVISKELKILFYEWVEHMGLESNKKTKIK